jgi:predicted nucleic acid-binding protein
LTSEEDLVYYFDMLDPNTVNHPVVSEIGVANIGYRLLAENKKELNTLLPTLNTPNAIVIANDGSEESEKALNEAKKYL